jgi:hypothetical protein
MTRKLSMKALVPVAAMLLVTTMAPVASAAGGGNGGSGGGNAQPAVISAVPCAKETISKMAVQKLGVDTSVSISANIVNCSSSAETVDVNFAVIGVSASTLRCSVGPFTVKNLSIARGKSATATVSARVPACAGEYVVLGLVSSGQLVLTGSSQSLSVKATI